LESSGTAGDRPRALFVLAAVSGFERGLSRRGSGASIRFSKDDTDRILALATSVAQRAGPAAPRLDAVDVLRSLAPREPAPAVLAGLSANEPDQAVRLAALAALSSFPDASLADPLVAGFGGESPSVRRAVLDVLLSNAGRTRRLLEELEAGRIAAAELDPTRVNRLVEHADAEIKRRAKAVFTAANASRESVLSAYRGALDLPADPRRGRDVFAKNCAACHHVGDVGVNVAPDIADSRTLVPAQVLLDVIDPNRKVDGNYFAYALVARDGRTFTGLLAAETSASVTLRQQENVTVSLPRDQIEELRSTGVSLMPVGLEKNISPQQMADLISFLKNWRYLDGRVPAKFGR
jgi:putative heme-binding domain-containing protein